MKEVLEAIKYWLIEKFDKKNEDPILEDIYFLRLQIEKKDKEIQRLTNIIVDLSSTKVVNEDVNDEEEIQPINKTKHVPWLVKKKELEENDRKKGLAIKREAEEALNRSKSTDQLEREILEEANEVLK